MRALSLFLLLALSACIDARDVDDGDGRRRDARNALSARITFDEGERVAGFPTSGAGPTITALEIALGVRAGQPFDISVQRTSAAFASLAIGIEDADDHFRVRTRSRALGFLSLREEPGAELTEARLLVSAIGEDGVAGTPLLLPFVVQEGGGPTAGANAELFVGDPAAVEALDYEDGVLVAGDERGVLSRWEDATRTLHVEAHEGTIFDVRRFGERIYSAGADAVRAFDGDTAAWRVEGSARAMDASESRVVFGGRDGTLRVLDRDGNETLRVELGLAIADVDILDDGERAAVALGRLAVDGGIRIVDLGSGEILESEDFSRGATAVASRGEQVAVAAGTDEVHIFDLGASFSARVQSLGTNDLVEDLVFAPDTIGAMTLNGRFVFFKPDGEVVVRERFAEETYSLTSEGDDIAFGDRRGAIWLLRGVAKARLQ